MQIVLIHNPSAGDGGPTQAELLAALHASGIQAEYCAVGIDDWKKALHDGRDLDAVVVAGGDGTVRDVANELVGRDVPIAIHPLGTANNLARSLGVERGVRELTALLRSGRRLPFDVGRVAGPEGESLFIEGAGIGVLAETMQGVDSIKNRGFYAVGNEKRAALEMLRIHAEEARPISMRLLLDERDRSGEFLMMQVMNIGYAGSNVLLAPSASPSDGWLEVVMVATDQRGALLEYIDARLDGAEPLPPFTIERARRVEASWIGSALHVDDRVWPTSGEAPATSVVFEVRQHGMAFLVAPEEVTEAA